MFAILQCVQGDLIVFMVSTQAVNTSVDFLLALQ